MKKTTWRRDLRTLYIRVPWQEDGESGGVAEREEGKKEVVRLEETGFLSEITLTASQSLSIKY